jgi:hypothetical protein
MKNGWALVSGSSSSVLQSLKTFQYKIEKDVKLQNFHKVQAYLEAN